jgi:hypothetical protein
VIELIKEGIALLSKVPPEVIPHAVEFLRGLASGDKARAERAATLATTEQLFERPR